MKTIMTQLRRTLVRCKHISLVALLFFVAEAGLLGYQIYIETHLLFGNPPMFSSAFDAPFQFMPLYLAFFLYLGYESCVILDDSRLWERLDAMDHGLLCTLAGMVAVLLPAVLLQWLLFTGYSLGVYAAWGDFHGLVLRHILLSTLYYHLFLPLTGLLIGLTMAVCWRRKRLLVYGVTLLWLFVNTDYLEPYLAGICYNWEGLGGVLYAMKDFITLNPQSWQFNWGLSGLYGLPLECYRWMQPIIYLSLCGLMLCRRLLQRRCWRRWAALAMAAALALGLVGYLPPGNHAVEDSRPGGWSATKGRYDTQSVPIHIAEQPGFTITAYDMELRIFKELRAKVTLDLRLDNPDVKQYIFTLYHGYRVQRVLDGQGRALAFRQDGDTVAVPAGDTRLTMIYQGGGGAFYANEQAIFLPGVFPYYPWEGNKQIYPDRAIAFDASLPAEPKAFRVTLATPKANVACSLPGQHKSWQGTAYACTLLAGLMAETEPGIYNDWICGGQDPLTRADLAQVEALLQQVSQRMGAGRLEVPHLQEMQAFKVFDNMVYWMPSLVMMGDHCLSNSGSPLDLAVNYLESQLELPAYHYLETLAGVVFQPEEFHRRYPTYTQPVEEHLKAAKEYLLMDEIDQSMHFYEIIPPAVLYLVEISPHAAENEVRLWAALGRGSTVDPVQEVVELLRQEVRGQDKGQP